MVRSGNNLEFPQKGIDGSTVVGWQVKLPAQNTPQLAKHQFADNQLVLLDHDFKKVGAETASTERARQHVGVCEDPHETRSNTSSSRR